MTPMMNLSLRMSRRVPTLSFGRRFLSADETTKKIVERLEQRRRGASVVQRFTSFLLGVGLTVLVTQYYTFQDLKQGNQSTLTKQKELEERLTKLEQKVFT